MHFYKTESQLGLPRQMLLYTNWIMMLNLHKILICYHQVQDKSFASLSGHREWEALGLHSSNRHTQILRAGSRPLPALSEGKVPSGQPEPGAGLDRSPHSSWGCPWPAPSGTAQLGKNMGIFKIAGALHFEIQTLLFVSSLV